jgi:hypothetical protein
MPEFEKLRDDLSTLPETAQQLVVDFVSFLKQRYGPHPLTPSPSGGEGGQDTQTSTPHPLNLENESFVGMWSDRPEMQDSKAWVRQIRQQHWRN